MKITSNLYDRLLVLMIWLLAAGQIGDFWQPVRVLILALIPFFLYDSLRRRQPLLQHTPLHETPNYRYEYMLFIIWGVYAAISTYWAIDQESSMKALLHLIICFFGFGELIWLSGKAQQPQKSILWGWLLMILTTLPIAYNELMTDQHLSMSVHEANMHMKLGRHTVEDRRYASVTFGNLNSYNVVLCMTYCMMLIQTLREKTTERIVAFGMLVVLTSTIIVNSSRAAFIFLTVVLLVYILLLLKKRTHILLLLGGIVVATVLFTYRFSGIFSMIQMRFESQGLEDAGRTGVLIHGLEELVGSYGLGIGINNFAPIMETKYGLEIAAPHNLWLEVGAQFGVVILLGFIGLLWRIYQLSKKGTLWNQSAAILGILALLPTSIIDSTYLLKVPTWMYIATLYVMASPTYNDTEN